MHTHIALFRQQCSTNLTLRYTKAYTEGIILNFTPMHEILNEPIEVLVKFAKAKVLPAFFKWRGKTYKIEKVNLVHHLRHGDDKTYYFSVSDNLNFFRLAFSTKDLSWKIEELYHDG